MNKIFSKDKNWVLLIGYVAIIYGTLQFMPKINSFFSSLSGRYFGITANIAVSAVITIIFVVIIRRSSRWKSPIFCISIVAVLGSYAALIFLATPIVAEKMHLLEYGFLGYLALKALKGVRIRKKRYLYAILIIIAVGSFDELIQKFTPGRYYEPRDVILNIVSGILGLFILKLLELKKYSYD